VKRSSIVFALVIVCLVLVMAVSVNGAAKKIVVGFSQIGAESAWRTADTESIISEAKKYPNIVLKFSDAQQKPENQIKAMRSFIAQKVDVIGFTPVVETGYEPVLREAKRAHIPVIIIDRMVDVKDNSLWVTHMGSDMVEEGRKVVRFMVEKGWKGNVAEMVGTVGSSAAIGRHQGFNEMLKDHPEFKVILSESGNFTRSEGKQCMEAFLKAQGKNINILFAHNDDMAIGAIQAIEEYGLKPGVDIKIISIDATHDGFQAMIEGKLNCVVECNPLLGPQFYEAVQNLMAGKKLPKETVTKEGVFPMEVAKDVMPTRKY
jgi:galactofuranose transport system substrate-binding protein